MTEIIVFADVEQLLTDWLPAQLTAHGRTVPVVTRVPTPRPTQFVRVMVTGGARNNMVQDRATVTYEAWAGTESAAASLAQLVRGLINSMPGQVIGGVMVYRSDDGAPVNLPDPDSAQSRYTGVMSLLLRGAAL